MSDQQILSTAAANRAVPEPPVCPRLRSDHKVAAVVAAFAIIVYALTMTFDEVPAALAQGQPPEAYPRLLVWVLIILAIALVFEARGRPNLAQKPLPPMVYKTAALLVVAALSIEWMGIFGAMLITCVGIPVMWGERRHLITGAFAVVLSLAVYGLFHGILDVQFPLGIFESMF